MSEIDLDGKFVKISRHGERFWLRNVRRSSLLPEMWIGDADNHLMKNNPFKFGDLIPFREDEVLDSVDANSMGLLGSNLIGKPHE